MHAELQQNHWYLDDGILAGTIFSVSKALDIIDNLGPDLGLHVNLQKCELFNKDTSMFPSTIPYSKIEILGAPVGDIEF